MEFGNATLSSLQLLTGFVLLICLLYNVALTVAGGDFVSVQRKPGERDIMIRLSGMSAMETTTGYGPEIEFIFREVTDGARLVQAVYDDQYQMKNCQITDDEDRILDLLTKQRELFLAQMSKIPTELHHHHHGRSKTSSAHPNLAKGEVNPGLVPELTKSDFELEEVKDKFQYAHNVTDTLYSRYSGQGQDLPYPANTMLDMETMNADCKVHQQMVLDRQEEEEPHPRRLHQSSSSSNTLSRQKRGFWTWPGTLWCGKGTEAKSFSQLGEHAFADRCCRDHDHCPDEWTILGRETKYHLKNSYFFTVSHCKCDKMFHQCLKQSRTTVANEIGTTFFNRFNIQCFVFKEKEQCVEKSWWGKCNRYEKVPTAVFRDSHTFPKSEKRIRREEAMGGELALKKAQKAEQRSIKMREASERRDNKTMAKEARMIEKNETALRKATKLAESDERKLNKTLAKDGRILQKEQDRLTRKQAKLDEREGRRLNKTLAKEIRMLEKEEAALRKQTTLAAREKRKLEQTLANEAQLLEKEAAVLKNKHQKDEGEDLEEEREEDEQIPSLSDEDDVKNNDQNVEIIEIKDNINNAATILDNSFEFEISGDSEFTRLNK